MAPDIPQLTKPTPGSPGAHNTPTPEGGRLAASLRGFGPVGIVVSLAILLLGSLGGVPTLVWARLSSTPWRDLGFVRPRNWFGTVALGTVVGCAFKFLMKMLVMPLLGAAPVNDAYHYLVGNRAALPGMILTVLVTAAFGEETVFRGFLFHRLGRLFGSGAVAKTAI